MKKLSILIATLLIVCHFGVQAQTYKQNKLVYNHREYIKQPTDPNNPTIAGISSFFIPGLGQVISSEFGRGLGFFGGSLGCAVVSVVGYAQGDDASKDWLLLTGMLGSMIVSVWSSIDAVKVAKVNNMYLQDKHKSEIKLELSPYIDYANYGFSGQGSPVGGLSLSMKF